MSRVIYLITGEPSGDLLGARLMRALKEQSPTPLTLIGIGGPAMEAEGLQSLFPMRELSLMGFAEIVPHIPRLLKRIAQTTNDILAKNPDLLVTIDSPGFCFRVVKRLRNTLPKGNTPMQFVHYVAPSVWAYKPSRAKKLAAMYDRVLTLLPFEPPYFTKENMQADFVGHPLVEMQSEVASASPEAFRAQHGIAANARIIAMLPGSRSGELEHHLPVQRTVAALLEPRIKNLVTVMPMVRHLEKKMREETQDWPTPLYLISDASEKWAAFKTSEVALAKSGTVSLELALAGVPMVVMYKVHPISAFIIRRMMKAPFASLVNILQHKEVIPEFMQDEASFQALSQALLNLLQNQQARQAQLEAFSASLKQLGLGETTTPSQKAATLLLSNLR